MILYYTKELMIHIHVHTCMYVIIMYVYTMYMCNVLINYYVIITVPTLHPTHISYWVEHGCLSLLSYSVLLFLSESVQSDDGSQQWTLHSVAGAGQLTSPERLLEKYRLKGLLLYTLSHHCEIYSH